MIWIQLDEIDGGKIYWETLINMKKITLICYRWNPCNDSTRYWLTEIVSSDTCRYVFGRTWSASKFVETEGWSIFFFFVFFCPCIDFIPWPPNSIAIEFLMLSVVYYRWAVFGVIRIEILLITFIDQWTPDKAIVIWFVGFYSIDFINYFCYCCDFMWF